LALRVEAANGWLDSGVTGITMHSRLVVKRMFECRKSFYLTLSLRKIDDANFASDRIYFQIKIGMNCALYIDTGGWID
jgi:hypothetical protein